MKMKYKIEYNSATDGLTHQIEIEGTSEADATKKLVDRYGKKPSKILSCRRVEDMKMKDAVDKNAVKREGDSLLNLFEESMKAIREAWDKDKALTPKIRAEIDRLANSEGPTLKSMVKRELSNYGSNAHGWRHVRNLFRNERIDASTFNRMLEEYLNAYDKASKLNREAESQAARFNLIFKTNIPTRYNPGYRPEADKFKREAKAAIKSLLNDSMKSYKIGNRVIQADSIFKALKIHKMLDNRTCDMFYKGQLKVAGPGNVKVLCNGKEYIVRSHPSEREFEGAVNPNGLSSIGWCDVDGTMYTLYEGGKGNFAARGRFFDDSVEDDETIEALSEEERQAIEDYKKAIAGTTDPKMLQLYAHILKEEVEHLEELGNAEDGEFTEDEIPDPKCFYTERKGVIYVYMNYKLAGKFSSKEDAREVGYDIDGAIPFNENWETKDALNDGNKTLETKARKALEKYGYHNISDLSSADDKTLERIYYLANDLYKLNQAIMRNRDYTNSGTVKVHNAEVAELERLLSKIKK